MPLATPPPPPPTALEQRAPVLVHDRRERHPLAAVEPAAPAVYARRAGQWLQYWLYFTENTQDRGIVRTGRHAGDWELVQVRVDASGAPREIVTSQHSGAERCPWAVARTRRGRPVVYVAHGSHAGYLRPGVRDRTWPDPNDEAGGDGRVTVPRVQVVSERRPAWMAWPGRWGGARARPIPFEQSSPRGPAFQGVRWDDPQEFAREATPCVAERCRRRGACDARENQQAGISAGLLFFLAWAATANRGRAALRRRLRARARAIRARTPGPGG